MKFHDPEIRGALEFIEARLAHLNSKEASSFSRPGDFVEANMTLHGDTFEVSADAFRMAAYEYVRDELVGLITDAKKVEA
jgi:hypothetical protein